MLFHHAGLPQTFPPKLVLLDFGNMDNLPEAVAEILDCYGCLDVLILNSSVKVKAPAQNVSLVMDKLIMDNNYFGPATLAKGRIRPVEAWSRSCLARRHVDGVSLPGVLPSMISRRTGHLLLVNSIQGKLAVPFRATCEFNSLTPPGGWQENKQYNSSLSMLADGTQAKPTDLNCLAHTCYTSVADA